MHAVTPPVGRQRGCSSGGWQSTPLPLILGGPQPWVTPPLILGSPQPWVTALEPAAAASPTTLTPAALDIGDVSISTLRLG